LDLVNLVPKIGSWISRLSFIFLAKFYLLSQKYDILYFREHLSGLFFRDFILEVHTLPEKIRATDLRVWQRARRIAVLTSFLKEKLVSAGVPATKIVVAPDAVDLEKFSTPSSSSPYQPRRFRRGQGGETCLPARQGEGVRKKLGLPRDAKIVMYTGHLYEWKGAKTLLEAALNSKFQIPNSKFIFVGGTKDDVKKFREMARGADNVLILGHKPHSEIPKYLAAADVLVLPNSGKFDISRHHTSPLKLFEYMAARKPIVASDLPSIREVLNETNAVLVKPDDPEALASGIDQVLKNPELRSKITAQSLIDIEQYTWKKRAEKIMSFVK